MASGNYQLSCFTWHIETCGRHPERLLLFLQDHVDSPMRGGHDARPPQNHFRGVISFRFLFSESNFLTNLST
jgi:hypothetical protein